VRPWPLFALIGVTFALSALYATILQPSERRRWPLDVQLAADAITVAAFVWFTGGVTSYFSSLFVLPVIAASILQHRRGALLVAVLGALLYVGEVVVQYVRPDAPGWSSWSALPPALPDPRVMLLTAAFNAVGFLAVGALSGSLAQRLKQTNQELADASTAIANLQAFSEHIVSSLSMGLVTTDTGGRILTFNRAAEAITGHRAASAIGGQAAEVLQLPAEFAARLDADPMYPGNRRADYRYGHADGHDIDLGLAASPFFTGGTRTGVLFTFQDVTALRKLERDARMQLRLAAVGEMAAGIAHEIRNPLASMAGSIQLLRQELRLSEEQAQLMDIVLRESARLNQTINQFLAYARPRRFRVSRVDLRCVLNDTAMLLRNSAEARDSHRIDVEIPVGPVWCEADEGQLSQIVWNLASNGLRAMPDGGRLRLAARPGTDADEAIVEVGDEGVGIPEHELDTIFQPFHSTFSTGTGLGMAIVHRIVSDYGGEIHVTSKPGAGTTVVVRLPARSPVSVA
jgi:two-component system sensor histidine kinase PilS (NtrC family)